MRWFSISGPFPKRLHFESLGELDEECERLIAHSYFRKFGRDFEPPLDDDSLQVLAGEVADVDMYAKMPPGEDGFTDFQPGARPSININESLSSNELRRKRLRTTITHEWFHAVYHRDAWEIRWAEERAQGKPLGRIAGCAEKSIIGAPEEEWMEFQAGYASCAILMPKSRVLRETAEMLASPRTHEQELVQRVSNIFDVSYEAATWRLGHLGLLSRLREQKQRKLF